MDADEVPRPHWLQCGKDSGDSSVGRDMLKIENGEAVDHSMNDDGNNESYHIYHTGEIRSGKNTKRMERYGEQGDYKQFKQYKKQTTNFSNQERVSSSSRLNPSSSRNVHQNRSTIETPGYGIVVQEDDCLDRTFDNIEGFACNQRTSDVVRERPPSPIMLCGTSDNVSAKTEIPGYGTVKQEDDCLDITFDNIEGIACHRKTSDVVRERPPSPIVLCGTSDNVSANTETPGYGTVKQEDDCLDVTFDNIEGIACHRKTSDVVRERPPSPIEICGYKLSSDDGITESTTNETTDSELSTRQDRLEQLRQYKRAIEKERLNQNQTIVIPRNYLYETEEDLEDPKFCRVIRKGEVGSSVTDKEVKKYHCCRKLALTVTILLITFGIVVLAMALFWPSKIL
jgi:hypothetical protein